MSETVKINLSRIAVILVIVVTMASAVGGGYITYDNAKTTRSEFKEFKLAQDEKHTEEDRRMTELEKQQSRFEGVMDERTRNTQLDVKRIYDIVKEWER